MPKDGEYHLLILGQLFGGDVCGLIRHTWDVDHVRNALQSKAASMHSAGGDMAVPVLVALLKTVLARYDGEKLNPQYVTVKRLLGAALRHLEEADLQLWPGKGVTPGRVSRDKAP